LYSIVLFNKKLIIKSENRCFNGFYSTDDFTCNSKNRGEVTGKKSSS